MSTRTSIDEWRTRFRAVKSFVSEIAQSVTVLDETDSTQDAARRMNAKAGDVIVAWRQTNGRGRLGRVWEDTGEDGVAMTVVMKVGRPERMAIAMAVVTAVAIERICGNSKIRVAIKWPNDVLADGRKIAGVLVEQSGELAYVGIGINVHQLDWPEALKDRATSFAQLGVQTDRLIIMEAVLVAMQLAKGMSDEHLIEEFIKRDCLQGNSATLRCGDRIVRGRVIRIDPMHGLAIESEDGRGRGEEIWLPAATTSVLEWRETNSEKPNAIWTSK